MIQLSWIGPYLLKILPHCTDWEYTSAREHLGKYFSKSGQPVSMKITELKSTDGIIRSVRRKWWGRQKRGEMTRVNQWRKTEDVGMCTD